MRPRQFIRGRGTHHPSCRHRQQITDRTADHPAHSSLVHLRRTGPTPAESDKKRGRKNWGVDVRVFLQIICRGRRRLG